MLTAPRHVRQPGPPRAARVETAVVPQTGRALVSLPPGATLFDALARAFGRYDQTHGAFVLLGGELGVAAYHTGGWLPHDPGRVGYGPAKHVAGPVQVVHGHGSFGRSLAGQPFVHVHAAFAEADGRLHAGHLPPETCTVGPGGLRALLTFGAGFAQVADAETGFVLFVPQARAGCDA